MSEGAWWCEEFVGLLFLVWYIFVLIWMYIWDGY